MKNENFPFRLLGYLTQNSEKAPVSRHEAFANAVAEHTKRHANDGMSLFVFVAPSSKGNTRRYYYYPVSAIDRDTAFSIAQALHDSRGFPPCSEWTLAFAY